MADEWDLVLLGCGAAKVAHETRLIDLYTGPVYRTHRAILEHVAGRIDGILSALHGWAPPNLRAPPYDATLRDARTRRAWSERLLADLRAWRETGPSSRPRLLVLAGRDYVDGWSAAARGEGFIVDAPLNGLPLGQRRALARAVILELPTRPGRERFLRFVARWRRAAELLRQVLPSWRETLPRSLAPRLDRFLSRHRPAVMHLLDEHLRRAA